MPMNSSSLHCMWSDRKSRLSLTRACEFFLFSQGWTFARARPVWTSGLVLDPWLICGSFVDHLWLICGSFVGFCGPLVNSWLDHCWTSLDSWVISSSSFQLELFVSLPCSEGLEWVVSLISAGFIGWKLDLVGNWGKWIHPVQVTSRANCCLCNAHTRVDFA